jgi:hypothetical protein
MEHEPFESQLDRFTKPGPMGKASVAPFRRLPPSRACRDFRAVQIFMWLRSSDLRAYGFFSSAQILLNAFFPEETQT